MKPRKKQKTEKEINGERSLEHIKKKKPKKEEKKIPIDAVESGTEEEAIEEFLEIEEDEGILPSAVWAYKQTMN
jgi:hypothetical protein